MPSLTGSCLCGAVRYSSSAEPKMAVFCHCRSCQKAGGGGYSLNVAVPTDSLTIEGSPKSYKAVGTSGQPVTRRFCSECGSQLFTEAAAFAGTSFVKGGSLDDPSRFSPTVHLWCDSAQPWVNIPRRRNLHCEKPWLIDRSRRRPCASRGLGIVAAGIWWQKNEARLSASLRSRLPGVWRELLETRHEALKAASQ